MNQTRHVQLSARSWPAAGTCGLTQTKLSQARTAPRSARFAAYSEVSVAERVRTLLEQRLLRAPGHVMASKAAPCCVPTAHKFASLQKTELKDAKKAVEELILSRHCNPIVVRLAWHDSGSYDKVCRRVLWSFGRRLSQHVVIFVGDWEQTLLRADY